MPLHLIKLCVGAESPEDLAAWRAQRAALGLPPIVQTRQTPKRGGEIIDGGSLYWVIKGRIQLRQQVVAIDSVGEGAASRCEILLAPDLIKTAPQPRRPFQGWRYLTAEDAPPDLIVGGDGQPMPEDLAEKLRQMGAW